MKYKLIIFDLDDTLIDTWNATFPKSLEKALNLMVENGLKISSKEESLKILVDINGSSRNTKEAIKKFLGEFEGNLNLLEIATNSVYGFKHELIEPLPGVIEMLNKLDLDKVIVTKGKLENQVKKLELAKIDKNLFKKIIESEKYDKGEIYKNLIEEFGLIPEEVLVVGDRFETDLFPAKNLGAKTAWVKWGRGKIYSPKENEPDYSLRDLKEIIKIIYS